MPCVIISGLVPVFVRGEPGALYRQLRVVHRQRETEQPETELLRDLQRLQVLPRQAGQVLRLQRLGQGRRAHIHTSQM